jgi:NADH-quinone oxidoreductase subunit M
MLWMYQRVFYGVVKNPVNNTLPDLDMRERGAVWPLAILALVMGVASFLWIRPMDPAVEAILSTPTAKPAANMTTAKSSRAPQQDIKNVSTGASGQ